MTNIEVDCFEDEDPGIDISTFNVEEEIRKFNESGVVKSVGGWTLLLRLYTDPKTMSKSGLILPPKVRDEDIYKNCAGLVVKQGKGVYKDDRYKETGPWCKVGDWITFPRHSGIRVFIKRIPYWFINEDAVMAVIGDPRNVSKYTY